MDDCGKNFEYGDLSLKEIENERKMSNEAMSVMYELMQTCQLCDGVIILDDGSAIHVHRAILSTCSVYFRTIFTTTIEKDELRTIRLHGVSKDTMTEILSYIYLRKTNRTKENVGQLLITADYLQIEGMVKSCCNFMHTMINNKTCISIMIFAQTYCSGNLAKHAQLYITRNFPDIVSKNKEFLDLNVQDLINILKKDELNAKSEEIVWNSVLKWINADVPKRERHIASILGAIRLGLLQTQYFVDNIKDHPYVLSSPACQPLVLKASCFLYERDKMSFRRMIMPTPAMARSRIPNEILFAIGGWSGGTPTNYVESYDYRADKWLQISAIDPSGPRAYHGTAVIGYSIYVLGGFDGEEYFNSCRRFNAATKQWREIAPMNSRRCYVSVAVLDDIIYAIGGYDGRVRRNSAEKYDYRTNQWEFVESMHVPRSDANACVLKNKIYITGGFNGFECLYSAEVYDPAVNQWTFIKNMRSRRSGVSCVAYHGHIYAIGGFNSISRLSSVEKYDPETDNWYQISDMISPRSNFAVEVVDDTIFAIGGFNGFSTIYNVECYDAESKAWYEVASMNIYRSALSACIVVGLPNVKDYAQKDRSNIMEEKRQKLLALRNRRYTTVVPTHRPQQYTVGFSNGWVRPHLFHGHSHRTLDILHQLSVEYHEYLRRMNRRPALQNDDNENGNEPIIYNNGDYDVEE